MSGISFSSLPLKSEIDALISAVASDVSGVSSNLTDFKNGFGFNFGWHGYQRFPNGLIFQWFDSPFTEPPATFQLSFPIAFPNICLKVTDSSRLGAAAVITGIGWDRFNIWGYIDEWRGHGNGGVGSFIAIGY